MSGNNLVGSVGFVGSVGLLEELLNETRSWFKRYVYTTNEYDLDVIAVWVIHTWLCEESYTTPRLLIDSPVPGSGKTTLLEHLGKLCFHSVRMAALSSSAMLARVTSNGIRTLLLDEADRSLDPSDPRTKDLIAILNSGYKKGGSRPVLVKAKDNWVMEEMPTFSPVVIAGNTPLLPDDTRSRCITIRLLPARDELIEPSDWEYIDQDITALADKMPEITEAYRQEVREMRPELPDGTTNRLRERWRPLMRIASVAGGDWPNKVTALIVRDIQQEKELAESGDGHVPTHLHLVRDIHSVFEANPTRLPTSQLVKALIALSPEQWSSQSYYGKDLTAQRLGRLLSSGFGINSQRLTENTRGYSPTQFEHAWKALVTPNKPTEPTEPTERDLDLF